ncbi:MAG: hypothetical protein KME12_08780 [Trichocoleus desertorum ATA4-8-CV12]|nr:hypothetical protein [Trichocoleus desertorum ATA4-8-CV12]
MYKITFISVHVNSLTNFIWCCDALYKMGDRTYFPLAGSSAITLLSVRSL